mmetsp:Transcript_89160/g.186314  ORF Transcript_89160/g.186314 Transcript_89160/m.186314 type:complete len:264 (-) Transcript_89160:87-878(-)
MVPHDRSSKLQEDHFPSSCLLVDFPATMSTWVSCSHNRRVRRILAAGAEHGLKDHHLQIAQWHSDLDAIEARGHGSSSHVGSFLDAIHFEGRLQQSGRLSSLGGIDNLGSRPLFGEVHETKIGCAGNHIWLDADDKIGIARWEDALEGLEQDSRDIAHIWTGPDLADPCVLVHKVRLDQASHHERLPDLRNDHGLWRGISDGMEAGQPSDVFWTLHDQEVDGFWSLRHGLHCALQSRLILLRRNFKFFAVPSEELWYALWLRP